MSLKGSLEDVTAADVLRFVALGRHTGTLVLTTGDLLARLGFDRGRLVSAAVPGLPALAELLVEEKVAEPAAVQEAVRALEPGGRSVAGILAARGIADRARLADAVGRRVREAVERLLAWGEGSFELLVGETEWLDDPALYFGDIGLEIDVHDRTALRAAATSDDTWDSGLGPQRPNATEAPPSLGQDTNPSLLLDDTDAPGTARGRRRRLPHPIHVVSSDPALADSLAAELPRGLLELHRLTAAAAAGAAETEDGEPTLLVVDLRPEGLTPELLADLHRRHPHVPLVAVVETGEPVTPAYTAGALAVVPPEIPALAACAINVLATLRARTRHAELAGGDLSRLRRVLGELCPGPVSATVALSLMYILSESVERAILFAAQGDRLDALGSFGTGPGERPVAELTRGLSLQRREAGALARCLEDGRVRSLPFREAGLPARLTQLLGPPASGQAVVLPITGSERAIAVIYADNGATAAAICDLEILDLAAAQAGTALENELLHRAAAPVRPG